MKQMQAMSTTVARNDSTPSGSPNSVLVVNEEDVSRVPITLARKPNVSNLKQVALAMRLKVEEKNRQCATALKDTSRKIQEIDGSINHILGQQGRLRSENEVLSSENKILKEENISLKKEIERLLKQDDTGCPDG